MNKKSEYTYEVNQDPSKPVMNANWSKSCWRGTQSIKLTNFMGSKPSHFPVTEVKLKYDHENIYVIFRVNDRYVRAVATEINGRIWEDSCVEFFFTPGPDVSRGYFNLEMNCKGIFLLKYHNRETHADGFVEISDCEKVKTSFSLKKEVIEEITEPTQWTVEYAVPFSILGKYMTVDLPVPGNKWRANFYKCGDMTSHPHWLTWAPVEFPKPNFHLPEFFGTLVFK